MKLRITSIGNSAGVILPKELLARLRLDKGDDRNSRMWLLQGSDPLFNPAPFPFRYKN